MKNLSIAAAMMRAIVGDKQGNLLRIRQLAAQAADRGAEFLLLPEACLSGYTVRDSMAPWAEPIPGPLTEKVKEISLEFGLIILAGLVERDQDGFGYLTQVLVGPTGVLAKYRKTHLGPTEKSWFKAGDRLAVVEAAGIKFGIQLCYEGHFPEISLALALSGAEVILIPHASPRETPLEKLERWRRYLPARAYDNSVFLAACNQAGDNQAGLNFAGVAMIVGPKGEILAEAAGDEDGLVIAKLEAAEFEAIRAGRMGYFLPQRRPELYGL